MSKKIETKPCVYVVNDKGKRCGAKVPKHEWPTPEDEAVWGVMCNEHLRSYTAPGTADTRVVR